MKRRRFISLGAGVGVAAMAEFRHRAAQPSDLELAHSNPDSKPEVARQPILVRAGLSRFIDGTESPKKGQQTLVRSFDSEGRLAALVVPPAPGESFRGAPLHVHHDVDEWLYILAGEFVAEVGGKRMRLKAGDSQLMPMKIPHRWSFAGMPGSGAIHLYTPAGRMDIAFDEPTTKSSTPPTPEQIKADFESCGMTLLGVPLTKEEIMQTGT